MVLHMLVKQIRKYNWKLVECQNIRNTKTQISPLSGSIKKQEVKFTNKDEIEL